MQSVMDLLVVVKSVLLAQYASISCVYVSIAATLAALVGKCNVASLRLTSATLRLSDWQVQRCIYRRPTSFRTFAMVTAASTCRSYRFAPKPI
jgi:hypothetical protein